MLSKLYSSDILTLASTLRNARLTDPDGTARRVSKLCGSELEIDVELVDERVSDVALRVQACALGQASAAILQKHIVGASLAEIKLACDGLRAMLSGTGAPPEGRFVELALLQGVQDYPARHQSVMLAWDGAVKAVEEACGQGET